MQETGFMIKQAQQKCNLMEEYLVLSQRQWEAINQDDNELVLAIIDQKQNIIIKVDLLELTLQDQIPEINNQLSDINRKT